jgi:antitoxin MazE
MEVALINVGNSKGIILSKTILEKYGFVEKIELVMKQDHLELKPVRPPREGWDEAFKEEHKRGEDELLIDDILDDDIIEEWEWK